MNKLKSYFAIYSIHINLIWMRMDIIEIQKKLIIMLSEIKFYVHI